jgi:hypothetical protein
MPQHGMCQGQHEAYDDAHYQPQAGQGQGAHGCLEGWVADARVEDERHSIDRERDGQLTLYQPKATCTDV